MDERTLSNYLFHGNFTEQQIYLELIKYKSMVMEHTIDKSYRKWIVFMKKRRDLEKRRLQKGWNGTQDFIANKIAEGIV